MIAVPLPMTSDTGGQADPPSKAFEHLPHSECSADVCLSRRKGEGRDVKSGLCFQNTALNPSPLVHTLLGLRLPAMCSTTQSSIR